VFREGPKRESLELTTKNYFWVGSNHNCRCQIAWGQCCGKKKDGGLSLVDRIEATKAFLSKWVVHALEPGSFNL